MTFRLGRCAPQSPIQSIPPSIVKAICAVQASLDAVRKSQKNLHGGYNYSSTDDIYAALTRKLGEVGLAIVPLEIDHEIVRVEKEGKTVQWLKAEFGFILATEDATWTHDSLKRSLFIQITGPQTHQAAQSYAEKAFLRSLFKIPTGDMDLDSLPQAETEEAQIALVNGNGKRKSSAAAKRDGTTETFNEIRKAIREAINREHLMHLKEVHADDWAQMPHRWAEVLEHEYEDKMMAFRSVEAAE